MHFAHRFSGDGGVYEGLTVLRPKDAKRPGVDWAGRARFVPEMLAEPLKWRKPQRVFVNSMSDLFHESLSNEEIAAVFGVMAAASRHTFQVLTKRPKRAAEWFAWVTAERILAGMRLAGVTEPRGSFGPFGTTGSPEMILRMAGGVPWPLPNVWLGVSTEDQKTADERIPLLLALPAAVRFISAEPLLGPIDLTRLVVGDEREINALRGLEQVTAQHVAVRPTILPALNWVIVGGESGNGARPFDLQWGRDLVSTCEAADVACFVKQVGTDPIDGLAGCSVPFVNRKGDEMSEWPEELRVREFPEART